MNFEQLNNFIVLIEQGNFTKAANALFISQPALTKQIQSLEKEIGYPLIDHSVKTIKLTEEGNLLYQFAKKEALNYQHLIQDIERLQGNIDKHLSIGYIIDGHIPFLEKGIKKVISIVPDAQIEVTKGIPPVICAKLLNHELDCALIHMPSAEAMDIEVLKMIKKCGAVARISLSNELSKKDAISVTELASHLLICSKQSSNSAYTYMVNAFRSKGIEPNFMNVSNAESIEMLMRTLNAISFTSSLNAEINGFKNVKVLEMMEGYDLVLGTSKENKNHLVQLFKEGL